MLFAFAGSTTTSNPSPPAASSICAEPDVSIEEPLSCRPPHTAVDVPTTPARAS
jgi:hypothetical protein